MLDKVSIVNLPNLANLFGSILILIAPFLFSGDWTWDLGWLFTISMGSGTIISRAVGDRLHPGLQRERLTAGARRDTKAWDKWIMPVIAVWLPLTVVSIAGLDERLGWSHVPYVMHWFGLVLIIASFGLGIWAISANPFFSLYVRIQTDRGHQVAMSGPYAFVRHPGYLGAALAMIGIPLLLDSLWGILPTLLILVLGLIRTSLEDGTLLSELPGYLEYAAKVRYRLIPGIW